MRGKKKGGEEKTDQIFRLVPTFLCNTLRGGDVALLVEHQTSMLLTQV